MKPHDRIRDDMNLDAVRSARVPSRGRRAGAAPASVRAVHPCGGEEGEQGPHRHRHPTWWRPVRGTNGWTREERKKEKKRWRLNKWVGIGVSIAICVALIVATFA